MGYPLARRFSDLPDSEKLRIQKRLGIILKRSDDYYPLKKTLTLKLRRLGHPSHYVSSFGERERLHFEELLSQFGILKKHQFRDTPEYQSFMSLPYVVEDAEGNIRVISEALDLILEDPGFVKKKYLLHHLNSLSFQEKKSWARWLGMTEETKPSRQLTRSLWNGIGRLRQSQDKNGIHPELFSILPGYLEDIFPEGDIHSPLYWFYKQVVPFYRSLNELEKTGAGSSAGLIRWITLFKLGYLFILPEEQGIGKPVKWKIQLSFETQPPALRDDLIKEASSDWETENHLPDLFFQS